MRSLLALLCAAAAVPAAAQESHLYPIAPVRATLRVEPGRMTADVVADSVYWIEEVLNVDPLPTGSWGPELTARAQAYLDARLRLSSGGVALPGRLVSARWSQGLGDVNEQGTLRFRLEYPEPAGPDLSGAADFYEEYRRESLDASGRLPARLEGRFKTVVRVPGRRPRVFELTPESSGFSMAAADARRTRAAMTLESLERGASAALTTGVAWPALLALALGLAGGAPSRRRLAACALAALAGAWVPAPAPGWLPWGAGALAAAAAGSWLGGLPALAVELPALAALGRLWAVEAAPWLPTGSPGAPLRAAASLGSAAVAAAMLAAGWALVEAERRRLAEESESHADILFRRRRGLFATVVLLACGSGLWQAVRP